MPQPRQHTGIFRYKNKSISFHYWSKTNDDTPPDTVLFLGAGQVDKIPYWIARSAEPGIVVVGGVPHWEADAEADDIEDFTCQYATAVFLAILQKFGQKSMHVIAESQAALAAIIIVNTMPQKIHNFALIRPLGFTVEAYGETVEQRLKSFRQRIQKGWSQFPRAFLGDPRNLTVSIIAYRAIRREPTKAAFEQKYGAGISWDATASCRSAAKKLHEQGKTFTLLLGEIDKIFPPKEILETLERAKIKYVDTVILPKTPHASLATKQGRAILRQTRAILDGRLVNPTLPLVAPDTALD